VPSLAFHDVTGSTLAHCAGKPLLAARGVRHQPKSAFGFGRNRCTTSTEIAVRLPPKWLFVFARPTHEDLMTEFGAAPQWPESNPHNYVRWLEAAGLRIVDRREWTGELRVHDIGALVYYLKAVPWIVPGFTVDSHASTLLCLHSRLESSGSLTFKAGSYLIEARKPD